MKKDITTHLFGSNTALIYLDLERHLVLSLLVEIYLRFSQKNDRFIRNNWVNKFSPWKVTRTVSFWVYFASVRLKH